MAGERKRIEEIQRRKAQREKALKRRIYMIRRIFLLIAALGIIVAIVFGIRGCARSIAEKRAAEEARIAAEEAAKPTPTPAPSYNDKGIDETFYADSAFFGNSFVEGMIIYELADGIDYFSKVGLTVSQALTEATSTGTVPVIEEFKSSKKYDKIFMIFGENEVGWVGDAFFNQYEDILTKLREYQPQATLYLLPVMPISKKVSDENTDGLNIDNIKIYNNGISGVARSVGAVYADVYGALVGEDGYLPETAASDGIHFGEEYYIKCLKYIQENYR